MIYHDFEKLIADTADQFRLFSRRYRTDRWQGIDISKKPEMETYEILHFQYKVPLQGSEDLHEYERQLKPNMPWADHHFRERIGGEPLNPGVEWANWPWANTANSFRDRITGQFDHNYMERYWPKHAGITPSGRLGGVEMEEPLPTHRGIRHEYGDLMDVVNHLVENPTTRQAYLPMFFPEDTGMRHKGRAPCSLGYHFMMRDDFLHITYYMRSCEFVRHFRDDLYLTVRLLLWVLHQARVKDTRWVQVKPGWFVGNIDNLHMFRHDWIKAYGAETR